MSHPPTRRSNPFTAGAAIVLLSLALCGPALAQPPGDLVVMTNGDRLTGEIKTLSRARLSFDVSATGIVSIKWEQVAQLTGSRLFEVETAAGERLLGTLAPVEAGKLAVAGDAGTRVVDLIAVVGLVPIRHSFIDRLDGSATVGGSYSQASGVAQLSMGLAVTARRPSFEWRLNADTYLTFQSDGQTSERFTANIGYSRYLAGRWAVFGGGQVERNPDLGFDLRATLGGGVERRLLQSNRSTLVVGAGLGGSREVPVDGSTETLLPALLTLRHSFFIYRTPKTSLDTQITALPILNQWGRWRLEANTSVSREILKDFAVAVTFYESFDNRPPSAEANRNDAGLTLSISFVF